MRTMWMALLVAAVAVTGGWVWALSSVEPADQRADLPAPMPVPAVTAQPTPAGDGAAAQDPVPSEPTATEPATTPEPTPAPTVVEDRFEEPTEEGCAVGCSLSAQVTQSGGTWQLQVVVDGAEQLLDGPGGDTVRGGSVTAYSATHVAVVWDVSGAAPVSVVDLVAVTASGELVTQRLGELPYAQLIPTGDGVRITAANYDDGSPACCPTAEDVYDARAADEGWTVSRSRNELP